jgi:Transposase DDE domain
MWTGQLAEQRVRVVDAQGGRHVCRRLRLKLNHATRDGATLLYILTNLPARPVSAIQVARLYQRRGTLETAFQHLEAYFHSEINTLGYPKAALFGFCLALVAYNVLAVVLAAWRGVHGQQIVDDEVALYYLANEVATTYHGMMIAIPEGEWDVFYRMSASEMAVTLLDLAKRVNIRALRKSPRGPKKPRPERDGNAKQRHVSTAKLRDRLKTGS